MWYWHKLKQNMSKDLDQSLTYDKGDTYEKYVLTSVTYHTCACTHGCTRLRRITHCNVKGIKKCFRWMHVRTSSWPWNTQHILKQNTKTLTISKNFGKSLKTETSVYQSSVMRETRYLNKVIKWYSYTHIHKYLHIYPHI